MDLEKFYTFNDAKNSCLQEENEANILTIHSEDEQEFISNFLLKANKILDNIWLGLKRNKSLFKWTDSYELRYENWSKGSPSNKSDHN